MQKKFKYTIKEVYPNIFCVVVPDDYHRTMLFMRAQEFYESPLSAVRGKNLSFFDYMEIYSRKKDNSFTYMSDWAGFNIPIPEILAANKALSIETPYDVHLRNILKDISQLNTKWKRGYILGVDNIKLDNWLFQHELSHGLYFVEPEFRKSQDYITQKLLPKKDRQILRDTLKKMGYATRVLDDEIQAYFSTEISNEYLKDALPIQTRRAMHTLYKHNLQAFL